MLKDYSLQYIRVCAVIHHSYLFYLGLTVLRDTLVPRSRGTYLALKELRTHLDAVYDVTIAYESSRILSSDGSGYKRVSAPGMVEFVLSYSPKLHVNVRRLDMKDVPTEDQQTVTTWLHDCYARKDRYVCILYMYVCLLCMYAFCVCMPFVYVCVPSVYVCLLYVYVCLLCMYVCFLYMCV